ncbi:hypothetical protein, partial [Herbaspirillum rhizosphaerae]|uniref:hypothetical protein n=1 Tax=Herbaspirillum rhizosphaerae TaxID=346179 RepID=UPI001969D322
MALSSPAFLVSSFQRKLEPSVVMKFEEALTSLGPSVRWDDVKKDKGKFLELRYLKHDAAGECPLARR